LLKEIALKRGLVIIGVLVALMGAVFFLQGIGILPGELMHNVPMWAVIGAIMVVVGAALAVWARRPTPPAQ
jgi:uncharacterized membrane protein YidH (DUF202 family)